MAVPSLSLRYLGEPALEFCGGRRHLSQQAGIAAFGPRSLDLARHPKHVRVGFVGSGESVAAARAWIRGCAAGVSGDREHPDFPGFGADRGFFVDLTLDEDLAELITVADTRVLDKMRLLRDRFQGLVELVNERVEMLSQRDHAPDYVVLALPDNVVEKLSAIDFVDAKLGAVHRDLRRALKARVMEHRIPTQIVRQRLTQAALGAKNVDHKSRCAWNFFTGLYFKVGGVPWSPVGLTPGTCYVGVGFYRPLGDKSGRMRTAVAQAFDEHGDGIVLRGQDFSWDEKAFGKSPHLDRETASQLIDLVLRRYQAEMKQQPSRLVVHKTSRFWEEERAGLLDAVAGRVRHVDLLAVNPTSEVRLLRAGQYPPLRGSRFQVGDTRYLYTTGYVDALKAYPHGHVPSPLEVADHIGDTDPDELLREILILSKMNWNSAGFAGLSPITLRFARRIGEIMREIPDDREPQPQFKYYI